MKTQNLTNDFTVHRLPRNQNTMFPFWIDLPALGFLQWLPFAVAGATFWFAMSAHQGLRF